ncbi:MAG: polyamine ABC transporter ATP-binding protein [Methylotenera sp.]|jgi:putrescine transport system ATP-binding protein|nr:polyamine ABC transporter ATP-binding protein [Methylotenera sp.]HOY86955.1 polyamine ABC transporter ATP-binding protein [Methylotenera sp.]HPH07471.1 polyamine ABC transporter ATP-binding protein [Methylotenera sp.]HPM49766.1 polyamine ABC transporter ATP-binding protein [Methylotenera sp.]HPV32282.1 polyamine ABC transporter ATP-binding protein [Methylotenera sp.]
MATAPKEINQPAPEVLLRVENVTKIYDGTVKAVDDVSLTVNKGEIFALLGGSGCGKSTLLRMMAGFEMPTKGKIFLAGQDITNLPPYQRPINMMFQSYALFPHLSVWENIAFGLKRDGMPKDQIAERVEKMLNLAQLGKFAQRKPHQLSGGQQQRVALVRSLAKRPQLLLLDEPLGALDKKLRETTQLELVNIIEEVGVTCVLVTHDQEEAMTMASRIAVMSEGYFLQVGAPDAVYEMPNSRKVADFIGNVNLFDGVIEEDEADHVTVRCPECVHYVGHGVSGHTGMAVGVALRPEKIMLSDKKPKGEYNWCEGEVIEIVYFGAHTTYHLKLDSGKVIKAQELNNTRDLSCGLTWGDRAYAHWNDLAMVVLAQ